MRLDAAEIKAALADHAEELARELVPDGTLHGSYWIGCCPWRADKHAGSFWVNLRGSRTPGSFKDAASGEKGSALDLVMRCCDLDFQAALLWSASFLGLSDTGISDAERRQRAAERARRKAQADQEDAVRLARDRERAASLFRGSKARPFPGSPAHRYLLSRGIDLRDLGKVPGLLGWLPDMTHRETGTRWPVMIAGLQDPGSGAIIAVHRTFLARDGSDKAPLGQDPNGRPYKARKVWPGGLDGAVIRLWRGGSGMREAEAAACGLRETLALVEGVEDGLSLALARPDLRIWCAYSLGNLAHVRLPECVDDVIVCADNDWGKPQATAQLDAAVDALVAQDATVRVARSHIGKDVNDCLRGHG